MKLVPLRLRLTIAFAAGMAIVLAALGAFLHLRLGAELLDSIDMGLRSRAQVIEAGINGREIGLVDQSGNLIDPDEAYAQILDPALASPIVESSAGVSAGPLVPSDVLTTIHTATFLDRRVSGLEDPARLLIVPVHAGARPLDVVVGATLSDRHEALDRLLVLFAIGGPIALATTSLAGWWLAGAALRPVERMRAEAAAISASEPDRRLPVPTTGDELSRLATTLNAMLGRLEESLTHERRFVDDASHELRTPLTLLKGELDLALSRPRTPAELQRTLGRASEETNRLARLAEDLLVLSRAAGGRVPVVRAEVGLRDVVESACEPYRGGAHEAGVDLRVDAPDELVLLDPVRIRQALENLVENGLRHAGAGGFVSVSASRNENFIRIRVEDSGAGFPPHVLDHAFEPFTRGPNEDGHRKGAGLGLAIVRAVAEAHGGSARIENAVERGACVELVLRT